ncbi:MAG TPA: hypothetical protein VHB45_00420 [Alloacidobacterium sp.]|nr:hypothetical protein [Alloacidobacterium sp.]
MQGTGSLKPVLGATAWSRLVLAFVAMLGTWLLYCGLHVVWMVIHDSVYQVMGLGLWAGMLAGITYIVFVAPMTAVFP